MNDYETTNATYGNAIHSKLKIETPQRRQCCRSGVFIAKLRHIFTTFQRKDRFPLL